MSLSYHALFLIEPGPDLAEGHPSLGTDRDPDAQDEFVVGEGGLAVTGPEGLGRHVALAPGRAHDKDRVRRQQDGQRVPGR